ncbi:HU family DNA-binding protein [Clostridium sp. NSJ-145]|uniref:HU family DNA-binding protein n=1 Tax=Clostridium sp. NSJ-145 TaxID=2897777 RepID=UPI001E4248F3|nr:HU family DNA-binding protein [Clostridium sp. NSJ-145]MCD2503324.1 HU family DNA-binding protein [Clostridium sp. NSJ-145]
MTKEGLVNSIYEYIKENYPETNYTKKEIRLIYETFINIICKELEKGSKKVNKDNKSVEMRIPLLGVFNITYRQVVVVNSKITNTKIKYNEGRRIYYSPTLRIKKCIKNK